MHTPSVATLREGQRCRATGGRNPMDWVATFLWIEWQLCRGLGGNFPADWVAEFRGIRNHLHKGSQALIEGRLRQRTWETPDGQQRRKHEVVADRVHFLGVRTQSAEAEMPPGDPDPLVDPDEDIPF